MKTYFQSVSVVLAVWLTGCTAARIEIAHDASYKPSMPATYAWRVHPDLKTEGRLVSQENDACVRSAVAAALAGKGMKPIQKGTPTLEVSYLVRVEEEFRPRLMESDWSALRDEDGRGDDLPRPRSGLRYSGRDWNWTPRETDTYTYPHEIGTLVIEFFAPSRDASVWRGAIRAEIPRSPDRERTRARVREAVDTLLGHFPGE